MGKRYELMEDPPPPGAVFLLIKKIHLEPIWYAHFQTKNGCFHRRLVPPEFAGRTTRCEIRRSEFICQAKFRLVSSQDWHWVMEERTAALEDKDEK